MREEMKWWRKMGLVCFGGGDGGGDDSDSDGDSSDDGEPSSDDYGEESSP